MAGEPELVLGDSNEWVAYLQQLLEHNGLPTTADGYFGDVTKQLVEQFQQIRGLPVTGHADTDTWAHLTGEAGSPIY
jgi:peptidoglycan hydrolase-like protein with peptidoglycan-binding domain